MKTPSKNPSTQNYSKAWESLTRRVSRCRRCPRLIAWREQVAREKRRMYQNDTYWGKAVPPFGDPKAQLLIIGLAPAAHGANRTGRMFTGDRSGDWLYRALHEAGFANQAHAVSKDDGLQLKNCAIAAVCHCAPPANKPEKEEIANCRPFLEEVFSVMNRSRVYLALGKLAFDQTWDFLVRTGAVEKTKRPRFGHGVSVPIGKDKHLMGSFHPSQQNTFTGKLTREMFQNIFREIQSHLKS